MALGCGSSEAPYDRVLKFHAAACLQLNAATRPPLAITREIRTVLAR